MNPTARAVAHACNWYVFHRVVYRGVRLSCFITRLPLLGAASIR